MTSKQQSKTNVTTPQDADASINEVGSIYLVAVYDIVLIALHIFVLILFVPFEGLRFTYSGLTIIPHTLLALYALFIGTESITLSAILFAASLVVLLFSAIELGLRTTLFGEDRLVSITAVLDVVLWFITLFYTIIALFYAITSFRYNSVLKSRATANVDEYSGGGDVPLYAQQSTQTGSNLILRRNAMSVDINGTGSKQEV